MNKFLVGILAVSMLLLTGCMTSSQSVNSGDQGAKDRFCNAQMESAAATLTGLPQGKRGICPVCGRQFGSDVKSCPYDGAAVNTPVK